MKGWKLLILFLLYSMCASAQSDVFGLYQFKSIGFSQLDLHPDMSYGYLNQPSCGWIQEFSDSGTYQIVADTILLHSLDTAQEKRKLLILNDSTQEKIYSGCWNRYDLVFIGEIDSTLGSTHTKKVLNNHEWISLHTGFSKVRSYYPNGRIAYNEQVAGEIKTETYYYENGQLRELRQYNKGKKSGDWYFFDSSGVLQKIEKYRRGRLRQAHIY